MQGMLAAVIGLSAFSLAGCGGGSGGEPSSPPPATTYTVSGTVSGLPAGTSIILKNNDRDSMTVASNSSFTFATPITAGGAFSVAIATQIPGQTCSVSDGTGTINAANVTGVKVTCASVTYTIGGALSGLVPGTSLALNNNGGDLLTLSTNAPFAFATPLTSGSTYAVTIATQPSGQTCVVSAGTGSAIDSNVTSVGIICAPTTYTISGTVTGLGGGTAIVLQDNGGDAISLKINSRFTFKTAIPSGGQYKITIGTQPLYQTCSVDSGSGTVTNAAITDVVVHCPYLAVLWEFGYGSDGHYPQAGLIRASDGNLYGTTSYGGANLYGTVFKFVPAEVEKYAPAGTETVVASFASGTDAQQPLGTVLLASDGNFYGTSYLGGAHGLGTVFKVTPSGGRSVLWSFGAGSDGVEPKGALIQGSDGNLYGTTAGGGTSGGGTVFKITLAGVESVLWNFGAGNDGADPEAALVDGRDGNFYGTTALGGTQNRGTVFKLTPSGVETLLWSFDYTSGSLSNSSLTRAADGIFYGTTSGGGTAGGGTVFKISPAGTESVLWNFGSGADGISPSGGVIQARDGNFYGTTNVGGTVTNSGTIFRLTPDGVETVLWDFGFGGNGGFSTGFGVVEGADGNLYGVTSGGGAAAGGTLFKLIL
jgi:uncharacterized repeat protein (TIGR03803 family)